MNIYEEIEKDVRESARYRAEQTLDAMENSTRTYSSPNGVAHHGVCAKFPEDERKRYIDNKEAEAIRQFKNALFLLAFPDET